MNINSMDDEQLASEIIELARQDLKDSTISKEAQYEALGIIADFVKPKLTQFVRQCVKDSTPEGMKKKLVTASNLMSMGWQCIMEEEMFETGYKNFMKAKKIIDSCRVAAEVCEKPAIHAAQERKGKDNPMMPIENGLMGKEPN